MLPTIASSTLMVVDIQERLMPAMHGPDQVSLIKNVGNLLQAFREFGGNVVVSEQYPKGLGPTVEAIGQHISGWPLLEKTDFSVCKASGYENVSSSVRQDVVLVGIEAHVCVLQTGRDLLAAGKNVWVPLDSVTSRVPQTRDNGLSLLERSGAILINTESLIFHELGRAGTDAFKRFSTLIR